MKQTAAARSTAHVPARSVIEDNWGCGLQIRRPFFKLIYDIFRRLKFSMQSCEGTRLLQSHGSKSTPTWKRWLYDSYFRGSPASRMLSMSVLSFPWNLVPFGLLKCTTCIPAAIERSATALPTEAAASLFPRLVKFALSAFSVVLAAATICTHKPQVQTSDCTEY